MDFEEKVLKTIKKYDMLSAGDTVVVGVSGGADSTALLTVLCAFKDIFDISVHIVHINHMLRGKEAERDCEYVRTLAKEYGLPFHLLECDVAKKARDEGISAEAAGREVRYKFFNEILERFGGGKIAVAHNKGDSAETTLINLIRGSSLNGLKGISAVNENVIRPLIECDRSEIEEYLNEKQIPYMTDSTNNENIYTRNIIRNVIIPQMSKINPNIISTIYDNSLIIGQEEDFINSVCKDFEKDTITLSADTVELDFSKRANLHIAAKRRLVLRCCEILTGSKRNISSENLNSVLSLSTGSKTSFNGIFAERSYDKFIFTVKKRSQTEFSYSVSPPCTIKIEEIGKAYSFQILPADEILDYEKNVIYLDALKLSSLTLRSRKDGDVFSPLGLGGSKKVKDFLIDLKMSRTHRDSMPVLTSGGKIAALMCIRPDEAFKISKNTTKILMIREDK